MERVMVSLTVNGKSYQLDLEPETPLLWVLRDEIGLTGTKFGCGVAQCGACTVEIDGRAMRSCSAPIGALDGAAIVTIEGLSADRSHPVQKAWIEEDVPQCGYCQSGQIMAVASLLKTNPIRLTPRSTPTSPISAVAGPMSACAAASTAPLR
jgi:aerobic-type carbon monoxide dehydrogenase small subunit (CoxS/CutS family)